MVASEIEQDSGPFSVELMRRKVHSTSHEWSTPVFGADPREGGGGGSWIG
jgi:hypothetical protein